MQSERHTQTLCEPAAGRLHLGYIHTDARVTFPLSARVTVFPEIPDLCIDAEPFEEFLRSFRGILVDLRYSGLSVVVLGHHLGSGSH